MLIVPSISNIYNNSYQAKTAYAQQPTFNMPKGVLAPLSRDTVSFSGGKKNMEFNADDESVGGINKTTAMGIYNDANRAYKYLDQKLNKILGDMIRPQTGKGSLSKPIEIIRSRIKDPDSIIEKSITRKLDSAREVKEEMTDIVGARIVMADTSREAVDSVINRLTTAVRNNELQILEIENYRPDPELDINDNIIKSYDYSSAKALRELKIACDDKLGTSIRKVDEDVPSGYMAIHMLVRLPNGFIGELQIIGNEVEKLKDIEDISFKFKNGKKVKNLPPKVGKMLEPLRNKDDEILKKEHNIYTRQAYIFQREKELHNINGRKKRDDKFLSIPDFMPENLDFNNIAAELHNS